MIMEKLKINKKDYYNDNKEKINIKKREKFDCECGFVYTYCSKARQLNSTKHQNYIK